VDGVKVPGYGLVVSNTFLPSRAANVPARPGQRDRDYLREHDFWPGIEIFEFCIQKIAVQWVPESHPMTRELSVIIERDAEGYYVGTVPALRGCHSQAHSLDELMVRIHEAAELCLEVQGDSLESLDFVGVQRIRVAS
jgi:predicted RNase H-like HicB family nuclease